MKLSRVLVAVLFSGVASASVRSRQTACPPVTLDAKTNVWKNYSLAINPRYREKVLTAADLIQNEDLQKQARRVADVGTFYWIDHSTAVSGLKQAVAHVPCNHIFGIVLQGLNTGADCATPGFKKIDLETYQKDFVDPLVKTLESHPTTAFALVLEPYTLPAAIANSSLPSCQNLTRTYYQPLVTHALQRLGSLANLIIYLDAGHGGNLGFDYNLRPAAQALASVYNASGHPTQVRGISVSVDGYNSWDLSPGEFATTSEGQRNGALNERQYIQRLTPHLKREGVPYHAVADMSRAGVQGLRYKWEDWCNIESAGFGRRPQAWSKELGVDEDLVDGIVWVKNGGVSDGASEPSLAAEAGEYGAYNEFCGRVDAYKPSPKKGEWNQGYFETLVKNARPSFCEANEDCWW